MNAKRTLTLPVRVGRALKQRREALDITQEEFAERVDMHASNYQRLEYGRVKLRIDTLERLACALGARPWEVLRDADMLERSPHASIQ